MIRKLVLLLLLATVAGCSTKPETEPLVSVRHGQAPVTFGKTVQTLFALRMVRSASDPMQSGAMVALAHATSLFYGLPPFDEASKGEEAWLRSFCHSAGQEVTSTPACMDWIFRETVDQLERAILVFRKVPAHEAVAAELLMDVEALRMEKGFPAKAIFALGENRVEFSRVHVRRTSPGLLVMVSDEHFRVFESSAVPWTRLDRIREILDRAAGLQAPSMVSIFSPKETRTAQVLFTLSLARASGIDSVLVWGQAEQLAGAARLRLVPENQRDNHPQALDLSGFASWQEAAHRISETAGEEEVSILVPVFRSPSLPVDESGDPQGLLPTIPSLERIKQELVHPAP